MNFYSFVSFTTQLLTPVLNHSLSDPMTIAKANAILQKAFLTAMQRGEFPLTTEYDGLQVTGAQAISRVTSPNLLVVLWNTDFLGPSHYGRVPHCQPLGRFEGNDLYVKQLNRFSAPSIVIRTSKSTDGINHWSGCPSKSDPLYRGYVQARERAQLFGFSFQHQGEA